MYRDMCRDMYRDIYRLSCLACLGPAPATLCVLYQRPTCRVVRRAPLQRVSTAASRKRRR